MTRKHLAMVAGLGLLAACAERTAAGGGIAVEKQRMVSVAGQSYATRVVRVPLAQYRVKLGLAGGKVGATESLAAIARRYRGVAAINGCFFDAYAEGPVKLPYHLLITDGRPVYFGNSSTTLGFNAHGKYGMGQVEVRFEGGDGGDRVVYGAEDPDFWSTVREGIACGPRLVKAGAVACNPGQEGFHEDKILTLAASRSAVGISRDATLLLVTCPMIKMLTFAEVMRSLGAFDAMNLDGGGSTALWCNGGFIGRPGRDVSNALLVVKP